jgi:hypothetical protein
VFLYIYNLGCLDSKCVYMKIINRTRTEKARKGYKLLVRKPEGNRQEVDIKVDVSWTRNGVVSFRRTPGKLHELT